MLPKAVSQGRLSSLFTSTNSRAPTFGGAMPVPGTPRGSRTGPLPLAVDPSKHAPLAQTRTFASRTATARGQDSPAPPNKTQEQKQPLFELKTPNFAIQAQKQSLFELALIDSSALGEKMSGQPLRATAFGWPTKFRELPSAPMFISRPGCGRLGGRPSSPGRG